MSWSSPWDAWDPLGAWPARLGGSGGTELPSCARSRAPPGAEPSRACVRLARDTAALVI